MMGDVGTAPGNDYSSLINLYENRELQYQRTTYDSTGVTLLLIDTVTLIQKYVRINVDTLKKYNFDQDLPYGSYRWESSSTALLLTYRQPSPNLQDGGVIICGHITETDTTLLENPLLWLPFPGTEGTLGDPLSEDTTDRVTLFSANTSRLNQWGTIDQVYGYQSGSEEQQFYSWFSIGNSLTARLEYQNGIRIRSLQQLF